MADGTHPQLPFVDTRNFEEAGEASKVSAQVAAAAVDVDAVPEDEDRSPGVWTLDDADPMLHLLGERIAAITGQRAELSIHRAPEPLPDREAPISLPPRYTWLAGLGEGGQGSVELVLDKDLGRLLALKTLLDHKRSADHLLDLYREARVTGQLDHPHIITIYDVGQLPDGRLYYTMPRMPGASLHDILVQLRRGDPDTAARWELAALVAALEKACHGVGYAHSHGVIHRDLKPANILLGSHGEVLVVDWGIAKLVEPSPGDEGEHSLLWSQTGEVRRERVRGSPPYMAPEQIQHPNQVTPAADVFCLGVILYEALTGVSPFPGKDVETIVRGVCHQRPVPPRERTPDRSIPAELEEICLRALEKFPGHRFATATELAGALADHLAGGRRKEAAARRMKEARSMHERLRSLSQRSEEARQELAEYNAPRHDTGSADNSEAVRHSTERLTSLRRASDGLFSEAVWALQSGLVNDPHNPAVHESLGQFYADRYADAELRGATREMPVYRALLRSFDSGRWQRWLATGCELRVATVPPGQALELLRVEERDGLLRPSESLGSVTAQATTSLPPGRYALAPTLPGGETESLSVQRRWTYPFLLKRGDRKQITLDLQGEERAGEAFAFVPGGPALVGGDSEACGSGSQRLVQLPPLALARHPVTVGAYDLFLSSLRTESLALAKQRRPENFEQQLRAGPKRPVVGVALKDARAYAAWLARATNRVIRLPSADEWEKSVRSADGRIFPWGDHWANSLCASVLTCQPADPPPAVGSFERDCSPFGVMDAAGGVWEWTSDSRRDSALVVGGSITSEAGGCRVAGRRTLRAQSRLGFLGFRVLMELGVASPRAPE